MHTLDREHVRAILLNTRHEVLGVATAAIGGLASAPAQHCSGDRGSQPPLWASRASRDDTLFREQLRVAGRREGIEVLDHIIIGERAFVSLRERRQGFP